MSLVHVLFEPNATRLSHAIGVALPLTKGEIAPGVPVHELARQLPRHPAQWGNWYTQEYEGEQGPHLILWTGVDSRLTPRVAWDVAQTLRAPLRSFGIDTVCRAVAPTTH